MRKSWPIQSAVNCNSENLIYSVSCMKAGHTPCPACRLEAQYIGLTTRKAKKRWDGHRASVNPSSGIPTTSVGRHFNLPGHSTDDMQFLVIEKVVNRDPFILKARESFRIKKYQAVTHGLNMEI